MTTPSWLRRSCKCTAKVCLRYSAPISVISGHAMGNALTDSYQVSRSLWLGRHIDTWIRSDRLLAQGDEAFVIKTPLMMPCRSWGCTGRDNQSTRIEAESSWIGLSWYCRFWNWRVRLAQASLFCRSSLLGACWSNHWRCWRRCSCSFCSSSRTRNQTISESAEQRSPIQSDTQSTTGPLPFPLHRCIVSRCSTQQFLVNGLHPIVSTQKVQILFVSERGTLVPATVAVSSPIHQEPARWWVLPSSIPLSLGQVPRSSKEKWWILLMAICVGQIQMRVADPGHLWANLGPPWTYCQPHGRLPTWGHTVRCHQWEVCGRWLQQTFPGQCCSPSSQSCTRTSRRGFGLFLVLAPPFPTNCCGSESQVSDAT